MHVPLIANWPGKVAAGKVSQDLVDTTDFLPTICEAAGVKVRDDLRIDGRSLFPQLVGEKGQPREWYYCWYAPHGEFQGEFAAGPRYKLFRNGRLFDVIADPQQRHPLEESTLDDAGRAAKKSLQEVLAAHKNARPAHLTKQPSAPEPR
jgi:arylsulfatase A